MSGRSLDIDALVEQAAAGDRRAVGRLLTIVEGAGPDADRVTELTHRRERGAHVIGVTGAPGAGKSTMVAKLVATFTAHDAAPAVLAVDPSSPLSGGAILGDRVRMAEIDDVVFVRSMATRGHAGGLALAIPGAVRVFDAAGHDPVVIETVGVGQVEVDVTAAADTTVVVVTPGMGDAVQANKAGLLEVADVFVVNKADQPGAADTRRDLELMLELSHVTGQEDASWRPPIVMTDSLTGRGVDEVHDAVVAHHRHLGAGDGLDASRRRRARFELASRVTDGLAVELRVALDRHEDLVTAVRRGELSPIEAATRLRGLLEGPGDHP